MFESPEARKPRPPAFAAAIEALAAYLRGVADGAAAERVTAERRRAYRRLFDNRVHLQRTLSEPPPAGAEAWSWIPLVTAAERIADRITGISALRRPVPRADLVAAADALDDLVGETETAHAASDRVMSSASRRPYEAAVSSSDPDVRELADEIVHLRTSVRRGEGSGSRGRI
ncbi:hypothetical protein [Gordonia paraffinivorans]|uniref:hypothetical protein n=1 Tax=Gordonia paraffinivorans TaxID=175628 RepID=UPI001B35583D|nr:hypothetical protein [Gordonia paraffinivorans]